MSDPGLFDVCAKCGAFLPQPETGLERFVDEAGFEYCSPRCKWQADEDRREAHGAA